MDNTQINEQWLELGSSKRNHNDDIVAISNTGKYRRRDGKVGILSLRQRTTHGGKREQCSHIIAEHFLITVKRPDQNQIDHITHHPTDYNINDVRNLRWCNQAENMGFEESRNARKGERNGKYGKGILISGDKNPNWKGDHVTVSTQYVRAKRLYKAGKITEEELQPYRDLVAEEHRRRKAIKKRTSDLHSHRESES